MVHAAALATKLTESAGLDLLLSQIFFPEPDEYHDEPAEPYEISLHRPRVNAPPAGSMGG